MSGQSDPTRPALRSSPEFDLIGAIRERMEPTVSAAGADVRIGIGDDAAITVPSGAVATSVDALVDGFGFRRRWCPPRSVGHKALAAALSDLAAMGARPGEAYVWLGIPADFDRDACLELADGIAALALGSGVAVLGGDVTAAPALSVCVTAVGHAPSADDLVGRAGAEPGLVLCATGSFGGAAAGLMLLEHPEIGADMAEEVRRSVIARQLEPAPRLEAGAALAAHGARAMIDVSDGLGADAEHLAAASGVGVEIELARVPLGSGVRDVADAAGRDPLEFAASGGEDYELLCALPRAALVGAAAAVSRSGSTLAEIGRFVPGPGVAVRLRLPGGRSVPAAGHDHLHAR